MKVVQLSVCEGPDERGWVYEGRIRVHDASVNRGACPVMNSSSPARRRPAAKSVGTTKFFSQGILSLYWPEHSELAVLVDFPCGAQRGLANLGDEIL